METVTLALQQIEACYNGLELKGFVWGKAVINIIVEIVMHQSIPAVPIIQPSPQPPPWANTRASAFKRNAQIPPVGDT